MAKTSGEVLNMTCKTVQLTNPPGTRSFGIRTPKVFLECKVAPFHATKSKLQVIWISKWQSRLVQSCETHP